MNKTGTYKPLILKWNKKGSLLVEALLTIVIMSVGLTFIIQSFLSSFRASAQVEDYASASVLLENKMNDLMQFGFIAGDTDEEGVFPEPYEKFRYHLKTENIKDVDQEGLLNRISLEVLWSSGKKKRAVALTTYLANLPK